MSARFYRIFSGASLGHLQDSVLARAYLLAESFIALRSVPAGVYETVQWPNFIPHV